MKSPWKHHLKWLLHHKAGPVSPLMLYRTQPPVLQSAVPEPQNHAAAALWHFPVPLRSFLHVQNAGILRSDLPLPPLLPLRFQSPGSQSAENPSPAVWHPHLF